jgi:capsular exopolysaccharide synthesis family protein
MSRLFEALQISEMERSGMPLSEAPAIATELLQSTEKEDRILEEMSTLHTAPLPSGRIVSLSAEQSLAAEKFRFLAVRLRQMQQQRTLKKILITSSIAEEGKSFVSANLAITLARKRHQKVLLIEGDLRRPGLAPEFGLGRLSGLSEALAGESGLAENIYRLDESRLWFLPAGKLPDNPLELMNSGRLTELMNQISNWFDWVVIDSPPILPLADTTVWTRVADGVLLIAREGKTEKAALKRGLEALGRTNILGVVLNSCSNVDHSNYYQRYGTHSTETGKNDNAASNGGH